MLSLEDDAKELHRRIKAVLDHYWIDRKELKGWLYCAPPKLVKIAETKNKTRVTGPLEQQLRDAIARLQPDLLALDPFVKLHALEENTTGDMDFVCDLLARMRAAAAALIEHCLPAPGGDRKPGSRTKHGRQINAGLFAGLFAARCS
ncbi:MAG: AAA family ATPase [Hyphomicrobiales bacterium]|nr:AAA family ATPase [Hyphomicrobiales bacterium]